MLSFAIAATLLASTLLVSAKPTRRYVPNLGGSSELVVYWGGGTDQRPLADFCNDDTIDIIPIGFVNKFPGQEGTFGLPGTNFGNACLGTEYYVDQQGHKTSIFSPCSNIKRDMAYCQQKGKKILISIGGDSPGNQLTSKDAATSFANQLWQIFGPKPSGFTGPRPFGDNVVDGFDLDIESGDGKFVPDLAHSLSSLTASDKSKRYYLTAAPQCPIPDARLYAALTAAPFDHVFVQFYNNPACAARASFNGGGFNWNEWSNWLSSNSMNKDISMFLGLPASPSAVPSFPDNYLSLDEATTLIESLMCSNPHKSQFGGVMLWEATFSQNNQQNGKSYADNIKDVIKKCSCYPQLVTTTSSSSTASSASSSTNEATKFSITITTTSTSSATTTTLSSATLPTYSSTSSSNTTPSYSYSSTSTTPAGSLSTKQTWSDWVYSTSSTASPSSTPVKITSTATTSSPVSIASSTSSSSSEEHTWEDWSSSSIPADSTTSFKTIKTSTTSAPIKVTSTSSAPADSTTTNFEHTWEDWSSSTSSTSSLVKITSMSTVPASSTRTEHSWEDWSSSTSSTPAVSTSATISSSYDPSHTWADWPSSSTSSVPAESTTTSTSVEPSHTWADWPSSSSSSTPALSTITSSYDPHTWADWSSSSSSPAIVTSSTSTWAVWSAGSTLSASVVNQGEGYSLLSPSTGPSQPVAPAPGSSSTASSSYPVAPATFTGAAPSNDLPGTVFSIAVCVAVAIGGLFL